MRRTPFAALALVFALAAGTAEAQTLKIGYIKEDGTTSEREIRPLGLFFWGAVWTLAAWCEMRKDYRSFRIDRIQQITDTERRFEETKEISLEALFAKYSAAETGN